MLVTWDTTSLNQTPTVGENMTSLYQGGIDELQLMYIIYLDVFNYVKVWPVHTPKKFQILSLFQSLSNLSLWFHRDDLGILI